MPHQIAAQNLELVVILVPEWLPRQSVIITLLCDRKYMQEVREKVAELSRFAPALAA